MKDPFAPSTAPRLKPVDVPGFSTPILLRPTEGGRSALTIGRAEDNDVSLAGGDFPSVSSHHVRFDRDGDQLTVRDLGSKNGTLVNGEVITDDRVLRPGDQVRLGSVGPKFIVIGSSALEETVFIQQESVGRTTDAVEEIVQQGARTTQRRVAAMAALLAAAIGWLVWDTTRDSRRLESAGQSYADELKNAWDQIAALEAREKQREVNSAVDAKARADRIRELEESLSDRAAELESTIALRTQEEERLQTRIGDLENRGASREVVEQVQLELTQARADLDETREALSDARRRVDLFDPVSVAQARLTGVGEVRASVVLIESRIRVRNIESRATLHLEATNAGPDANFEGRGEEFSMESTGSGFCIDGDGWIITNAHVVVPPDSDLLRALSRHPEYEQFLELNVVFSGDSTRHAARIERVAANDVDLALVKIEPFAGMPTLTDFRTDVPPPTAGSDIYLFGFPLGHLAVQEGETVIASTFRGILSRNVGGQMQVDAGVHPGNSGGPITDTEGRVVGVVVSVQALPDRTAVYTIGYGIPIADAASIWPLND